MLLGWAGWDHREQAHALVTLIEERSTADGWDTSRLTPLLAGLAEIMPWVRQWHAEIDDRFGVSPAEGYEAYLADQREKHSLTEEELTSWTGPPVRRGRPRKPHPAETGKREETASRAPVASMSGPRPRRPSPRSANRGGTTS
jgi:hypothetical protein